MNEETNQSKKQIRIMWPLQKIVCCNCGGENLNIIHVQKDDDDNDRWIISCNSCNEIIAHGDINSNLSEIFSNGYMKWESIPENESKRYQR